MDQVFIQQPFAFAGDVAPIPFPVDLAGNVSFNQGYGVDYQRDLSSDPLAKAIERDKQNYLFNVITQAIQQYQVFGTPEFITSADNGGAPYSYAANARVRYRTTPGDPWGVYISLVDSNVQLPTVTTHWRTVDQAITPAQFDNDTSIATTAFVQGALGNYSNQVTANSTQTLTAAQAGRIINGSGTVTLTLPASAGVPNGATYQINNIGSGTVTVQGGGGGDLLYGIGVGTPRTFALGPGDSITIARVGAGTWYGWGGLQLGASAAFGSSLAATGYQRLPSGLIIQWGPATTDATNDVPISFPVAFPTACRSVVAIRVSGSVSTPAFLSVGAVGTSSFGVGGWTSATGARAVYGAQWIAIGH